MSTSSPPLARLGVQTPRLLREPAGGVRDGHKELLKVCADVGLEFDEWQEFIVCLWFRERADGSPASAENGEEVPRQNGKSPPLLAVALDSLFIAKHPLLIWTAQEFDTAVEHYARLRAIIEGSALLHSKVRNYYQSGQRTAIVLKDGRHVEFKARNKKRGRGFSAPRVILDEAMFLTDSMMGALFPTMAAQSMSDNQPQLFYAGSAPLEESTVWRGVRNRAQSGDGASRLAYAGWSVDENDYDVWDRDGWAQANPALGIRISEEYIADEYYAVGETEFVRERLGVPDPDPATLEASFPPDAWQACEDLRTKIDKVAVIGVDVDPDQKRAAIALSGPVSGRVAVEVPEARAMGDWLVPRIVDLQRQWGGTVALHAGSGAAAILPDLVAAGLPLIPMSTRDVYAACARLSNMVAEGKLRHRGEPHLSAAVIRARRRRVGEAFVWNRREASDDLTPLFAVTLAAWPQEPPKTFFSY